MAEAEKGRGRVQLAFPIRTKLLVRPYDIFLIFCTSDLPLQIDMLTF